MHAAARIGAVIALLVWWSHPAGAETRWSGQSGAFSVIWTDDDIIAAAADGKPVFRASDFAQAAQAAAEQRLSDDPDAPPERSVGITRKISVLSLAGRYLGIRDESVVVSSAAALRGGQTRYWTIDLASARAPGFDAETPFQVDMTNAGALVAATSLFAEADLLAGLKRDRLLKRAIPRETATLAGALAALAAAPPPAGQCYAIPADLLTRFVLIAVKDGRAAIRIGLPGAPSCRDRLTPIGLSLPLRPEAAATLPTMLRPPAGIKPIELSVTIRVKS
jgi:hypothetical protein